MSATPTFNNVEEELAHYKQKCAAQSEQLKELDEELSDFQEMSKALEVLL
jgi:hypothetical protein